MYSMQERENLLKIFREVKVAVSAGDSAKIKNLSDQTTHTASLTHDPDNIVQLSFILLVKLLKGKITENFKGGIVFMNLMSEQ